jgi:hypothetical protein
MKNNITKREKLVYSTMIALIIAILSLYIITDVYARYSSTLYGSGNLEIASWSFKVNDSKEGEQFILNIKTTDNITKISPNATGTMYITVKNESDVNAKYTISLKETMMDTQEESNAIQLYLDDSYSEESKIDIKNQSITGKLDTSSHSTKTVTLYWKWIENTKIDQTIAEKYKGFTFEATIVGEETEIAEGENFEYTVF